MALAKDSVLETWKDIPLDRNEFICLVEDAKQEKTRERRNGKAEPAKVS